MSLEELSVPNRSHFQAHESATSTIDLARTWARKGAADGATVVADRQTSGRGRSGRVWYSPPGVNLYISQVIVAPLHQLRFTPILGAVAVREALLAHLSKSINPVIKWPNDILVNGSKLAGILAEIENHPNQSCILGIGINVNATQTDLPKDTRIPATSMRLVAGNIFDRKMVLTTVLDSLDKKRITLKSNPRELLKDYSTHCITLGKKVRVTIPDHKPFFALASSLDEDGNLLVEDDAGRLHTLLAADVDLIL